VDIPLLVEVVMGRSLSLLGRGDSFVAEASFPLSLGEIDIVTAARVSRL
jgi:hypothetical protein